MAKRTATRPEHNYKRKLRYLLRCGALPHDVGVHEVIVYHDDWCRIYQDKRFDMLPGINAEDSGCREHPVPFLLQRPCPGGFSLVFALCPTLGAFTLAKQPANPPGLMWSQQA